MLQKRHWLIPVLCAWWCSGIGAQDDGGGGNIRIWDLGIADQEGQLTVYNPDPNDAEFGTPVRAGDLNDDGLDDLVISAMAADGPPEGAPRDNAGEVSIYFSPGRIEGHVDLRERPAGVVTIYGERARDIFGIKSEVVDVDGDGLNDLLVGAFYADVAAGEREDAGKLYMFSGTLLQELLAGDGQLDLGDPWPPGVGVVVGPEVSSRLGVWMAAGDVDGDGHQDVVVGADQASGFGPGGVPEAGRVYVLYGPVESGEHIDLADSDRAMSVIYGIDESDHAGSTLAVGDVNGDGFDDVIIGAAAQGTLRNAYDHEGGSGDGPDNGRPNAGEMYVVFGESGLPRDIDLAQPPQNALFVFGAEGGGSGDQLGEEIVTADVNGDGIADMLIGAYLADGPDNSRPRAGEVYVLYGSSRLPGNTIDMAEPPEDVTVIFGARDRALAGDSIAAGDIHGDGYDDLFIGVPADSGPLRRVSAGGIVVIAGSSMLPKRIDLTDPALPIVWIEAPDEFDFAAYWSASGDMDGDGFADIILNGMAGDGPDNTRENAGEAHVVSGRLVARMLGDAISTAVNQSDPSLPAGSFEL